jgi:hypothetical protein
MRKRAQPEMAVSCKRKDVLRLSLADYQQWAEPITTGFERAAQFLFEQHIFDARDVPYTSQLVPLAAMFVALGDRANMHEARARMARWYWCGVFGELYGGSVETRFAKDLPDMVDWVNGGAEPTTVIDANFAPVRLLTMRTRNSAAYKGISALLMREGARDFRSGVSIDAQLYTEDAVDIHHIFPRDYCARLGVDSAHTDSVVNKTPLSARTNRIIGGRAPSDYLAILASSISADTLEAILRSHAIEPATLRANAFEAFFTARSDALLDRIGQAMGKPVVRDAASNSPETIAGLHLEEDDTDLDEIA